MSLDINELVKAVKQAAVEAVRAEAPVAVCYGTVTSASPLKIQVDQKKTLTDPQLILTDNVRDFNVEMSTIEGTGKAWGRTTRRTKAAAPAIRPLRPTSTDTRAGKSGECTTPSR